MCVTSVIGPGQLPFGGITSESTLVFRHEFDELKRQVDEMVSLLKRAKKYDADNNEPDCEVEDKMALLRKVAAMCGVNLDEALSAT